MISIKVGKSHSSIDYSSKQDWHRWLYDNIGDSIEDWYIYEHHTQFVIAIANDADAVAFKLRFGLYIE